MTSKPITPEDAIKFETHRDFPDVVLDGFNNMIKKKFRTKSASFNREDVIVEILKLAVEQNVDLTRQMLFDKRWLDVELFYEANGWNVEFNKPAYFEDYSASFTFTIKT